MMKLLLLWVPMTIISVAALAQDALPLVQLMAITLVALFSA